MKRFLLAVLMIIFLATPAMAWDDIYMISMGGPNWSSMRTDLIPATDDTYDIGSSTKKWKDLHIDGIGYFDGLDMPTVTDNNIPYMQSAAAGFGDSPMWSDGSSVSIGTPIPTSKNLDLVSFDENAELFLKTYSTNVSEYSVMRFRKSHNNGLIDTETLDTEYLGRWQFEGQNSTPAFAPGNRFYVQQSGDSGTFVPAKAHWESADADTLFKNQFVVSDDRRIAVNSEEPTAAFHVFGDLYTALTGTVTTVTGSPTVEGAGTDFVNELTAGDSVRVLSDYGVIVGYEVFTVQSVTDADTIVLDTNYLGTGVAGVTIWKDSDLQRWSNGDSVQKMAITKDGYLGLTTANITVGSGTGITVNSTGHVNSQVYEVTTAYGAYTDSDTTKGIVICTLPAKTKIVGVYADTTAAYTGGAVSATTLRVGITAEDAAEIIADHDVKTAVVTKGLADADMGTSLTRAAAIQGGYLPNWAGTTAIYATINTTTANTEALTAGSTTFYIETERY